MFSLFCSFLVGVLSNAAYDAFKVAIRFFRNSLR